MALEQQLAALMADAAPPERDVRFELAVMARIERARFRAALVADAGLAALAALVLFALAPVLVPAMEQVSGNLVAALLATVLGILAMQWSLRTAED